MGESVESVKQNLRSVLVSSKAGVKASRLQGDYQELCGGYIPHTKFGFSTLHEFMVSIKDVVRIGRNNDNEITYFAVADSSTKHIQAMVSKQKSKKQPKKRASTSSSRNRFSNKPPPKPYNTQTWSKPSPKKMYSVKPKRKQSGSSPTSNKENFKDNTGGDTKNSYYNARNNNKSSHHNKEPVTANAKKPFSTNSKNVAAANTRSKNLAPKFYKSTTDYSKTRNIKEMPPRFLKKPSGKFVSEIALYENPLQSQHDNGIHKTVPTETNNRYDNDVTSAKASPRIVSPNIDEEQANFDILHNMKKLLSIYECGLHLSGVFNLYKETFDQELPVSLVNKIVHGDIVGYATVEKVNITDENKYILFPYIERTSSNETVPVAVDVKPHSSLTLGEEYEAVVTYSPTCNKVYIQLVSEISRLKEMSTLIEKSFKASSVSHLLKTGSYVITDDFFRAKVLSINKQQIEVYKIDYENCTASYWTTMEEVRPMSREVADYPEFCVCCNMHRPANELTENWSSSSAEEFLNIYANTELLVKTIGFASAKSTSLTSYEHTVIFYKVNEKYKCNINARLIEEENAIHSELANHTDPFHHQPWSFANLPDQEVCQLFVFNIFCTTEAEVCIIGNGFSDELANLETQMFEFYSTLKKDFNLPLTPPCDCVYAVLSEDNCTRGKLISIDGKRQGTVYLVDNGETEFVSLQALRPLTKEFARLPMQSITVCLAGLDHEPLSTHSSILQKLSDIVVHKTCPARIIARHTASSNTIHHVVELYYPGDVSVISVNQMCLDMIMDESLMPTLPSEGDISAASVGNVDVGSSLVFLRLAGEGMVKLIACLSSLESSIDCDHISPSLQAVNIYPGKLCLVIYQNSLYRARIQKSERTDSQMVAAYMIDLGVYKDVNVKSLIKLDDETTLSIPPQAVCCKLSEEVPDEGNMRSLKDVSSYITSVPVSMRVDRLSTNDEPDLVSLWINDKNKLRIVAHDGIISRTPSSSKTRHNSSSISNRKLSGHSIGEPSSFGAKNSYLHTYRANSDVEDLSSLSSTSNSVKSPSPFPSESGDALAVNNAVSSDQNIKQYLIGNLHSFANFMFFKTKMKQYQEVLRLEENPFLVRVEDVVSPEYLQIISLENLPGRELLASALNGFYERKQSDFTAKQFAKGQLYAMHASSKGCWYRVRVLNMMNNEISVYLIDHGEFCTTSHSCLRILDRRFKGVADLVFTARLSGIKPIKPNDTLWPDSVSAKLRDMIKTKCYYAHVLKIARNNALHRDVWEVCLCDTSTGQDLWINDLLVDDWKCATYVE